jgi:hypothetical protein
MVPAGGTVDFKIKLTNPSRCPVGNVQALLIPFTTLADFGESTDPDLLNLFQSLVLAACSGQPVEAPGGVICHIDGGMLICDFVDFATAPEVIGDISLPLGGRRVACHRAGSRVTCQLPMLPSTNGEASGAVSTATLVCTPSGDEAQCTASSLAGGEMVMANVSLTAPPGISGTFQNLVFAGAFKLGVCKTGADQGQPCNGDSNCTGGGVGSCGEGICVNDMSDETTGVGCDVTADCGTGASCVACRGDGPSIPLGIACSGIGVNLAAAPTMSPWALATATFVLLAIGVVAMRRQWPHRSVG